MEGIEAGKVVPHLLSTFLQIMSKESSTDVTLYMTALHLMLQELMGNLHLSYLHWILGIEHIYDKIPFLCFFVKERTEVVGTAISSVDISHRVST